MQSRHLTTLDRVLGGIGSALRHASSTGTRASRQNPAAEIEESDLCEEDRSLAGALMRVNHAGEVAAQGLYQGHAAVARNASVAEQMAEAAAEELDHLGWCEERLKELDARPSALRPLWYSGAFTIGALSGAVGDKWSLGFVQETEKQVAAHLKSHLARLPAADNKSRAIVSKMREEEEAHGANAEAAGAARLPRPARQLMRVCAALMTRTAYWI